MRHWIKDCFCIGLSNAIALPAFVGTRLIYGRQAKRRTRVREVLLGFVVGLVAFVAIIGGMLFGV